MLPLIVKSPPITALPVVVSVAAFKPASVVMFPTAVTWPGVIKLPLLVLPVTLRVASVPIPVATTPVS